MPDPEGTPQNQQVEESEQPVNQEHVDMQPADGVGHSAVAEAVAQVPVSDEPENLFPDRVEDVEKAHAMAIAGDANRSTAAELRQLPNEDLNEGLIREKYIFPHSSKLEREDRRGHEKFVRDIDRHVNMNFYPWDSDWDDSIDEERLVEKRKETNAIAERLDERANKLEQWAAVLHAHPISEKYKEQHPKIEFKPSVLEYFSEEAAKDQQLIDKVEAMCADLEESGFGIMSRNPDYGKLTFHWRAGEMLESDEKEKLAAELDALETNPDTTQRQLGQFHAKLYRIALEPTRSHLVHLNNLLDDVRSGRASQSPGPSAPEQAAA